MPWLDFFVPKTSDVVQANKNSYTAVASISSASNTIYQQIIFNGCRNRSWCNQGIRYAETHPPNKYVSVEILTTGIGAGKGIDVSQFTKCKLILASDITPTIRALQLQVINKKEYKSLDFKPGQWVDFYVDHLNKLTGYSITSIPKELENNQTISLAIKKSDDLITKYVHSDKLLKYDKEDINIYLKIGGNFYFNKDNAKHYILICGGIGITPFSSVFKYYCKYCDKSRITLLYSVSTPNEFALLDELKEYQKLAQDRSDIVLTVTKYKKDNKDSDESKDNENEWNGRTGRIDIDLIKEYRDKYAKDYDANNCEYLVCGPSSMIDGFNESLQKELNVDKKQIHFEKWW